ncbi:MAG: integrase domain-containing protein [Blastocatellia bacterium]|nr:integrase domain-containing protein [Blastocatellia bacterium]
MRQLNFDLKEMCLRHRDGSYGTQHERLIALQQMADDLFSLGFHCLRAHNLKPKHVDALVCHWKENDLKPGTLKNRMSHVRWWAAKIGKGNVVLKTNDEYKIERRCYIPTKSKAHTLSSGQLDLVTDNYTLTSLKLQQWFGLRRETSIKFIVSLADRGHKIVLKPSWTKGKKVGYEVAVRLPEQRALLDEVRKMVGEKSLIPSKSKYVDQLNRFKAQCEKAGINNVHGLRHHYIQMRYEQLTGWKAPVLGGPTLDQLSPEQKDEDRKARILIAKEIGHEREDVTNQYLGK